MEVARIGALAIFALLFTGQCCAQELGSDVDETLLDDADDSVIFEDDIAEKGVSRSFAACGETHRLTVDKIYIVRSRNYPDASPTQDTCNHYFTVEPRVKVQIQCYTFNTFDFFLGGDEFMVVAPGYSRTYKGQALKGQVINDIPVRNSRTTLEINFHTGWWARNQKFDCRVRGLAPSTPTTQRPTTQRPSSTQRPPTSGCTCGIVNRNGVNRIVGGTQARQHEYPWQVGLVPSSSNSPFCGGTIISPTWVMTAAHCVHDITSPSRIRVRVGDHQTNVETQRDESVRVRSINPHPYYNTRTQKYDFALLELQTRLTFNNYIRAACLPLSDANQYVGKSAIATGWGSSREGGSMQRVLYEVDLTIHPNRDCREAYGSGSISDLSLCASGTNKDTCQGDSGGPLVVLDAKNKHRYTLVGVTSFGNGCARPGYPGVYARVGEVLPWINSKVKDYCRPAV